MIRDYIKMAVSNLLHRRTRSWLTLIGIFIGIMAVVGLVSLGQGLDHALTSKFLELGADKILITADSPVGNSAGQETENQLRDRDLAEVERVPGVAKVASYWWRSAKVEVADSVAYYPIIGATDDQADRKVIEDFMTLSIGEGRGFEIGDDAKAVIGPKLADPSTAAEPIHIGQKIVVNGTRFEVIGVYEKTGDPVMDASVYISDSAIHEMFGIEDTHDALIIQTEPGTDPEIVAEDIRRQLLTARNLDYGEEDFSVQTPKDLVDTFRQVFSVVNAVIIGIALISLVVGGVGIMNTMYTAVLERTQEIGVMKAIGATNAAIIAIFIVESGLLGLFGGAIGLLSGMALAKTVEIVGTAVLGTNLLKAIFPWWLVAGALLFAFTLGVVSGILPARQASRQQAVESLRYE